MRLRLHSERPVKFVARKKIVFIIVEGPSDDEAIGTMFSRILDKNEVYVHIVHGDITTDIGVSSNNIISKIGNIVQQYAKDNHFKKSDFKEIIHIVDTDGAYINSECVTEDESIIRPVYHLDRIVANNKNKIVSRNTKKSAVLDRLSGCKVIWKDVPYYCYYMSCNLDHVLYDKMNSTDEEKEYYALRFAKKYKNNIEGFITFMLKSDFSVVNGYQESWKYIREDLHSLQRNSNLGIYFLSGEKAENELSDMEI